jgi:4-carboxymuconolactone decarboxylase
VLPRGPLGAGKRYYKFLQNGRQDAARPPRASEDTGTVLFRELWLRPDLAPRDLSIVNGAALITSRQFAQMTFHLGQAMDNGLTSTEATEIVSHFAC